MSFIIAVVGGSGSGKTTLTNKLLQNYPNAITLKLDMYYKDQSHLPLEERAKINFDDPDTLDERLFAKHLKELKKGNAIDAPIYDFATHTRKNETNHIEPAEIIIVDGILSLWLARREQFDFAIYIDADADTRLGRRILRDVRERGRTPESVIRQYITTVKPMHLLYVESCRHQADFVFSNDRDGGLDQDIVDVLIRKIDQKMHKYGEIYASKESCPKEGRA